MTEQLVLATANPGKVAELTDLLGDRYRIVPRPGDLAETVEDGATLEENATKKAREVAEHVGAASLADDTGLFVEALDGRPGVHTARYAGPRASADENVERLLSELDGQVGAEGRAAAFRTVLVLWRPGEDPLVIEGVLNGSIAMTPRGARGFGYDPVFVPADCDGRTLAEMSADEKNRVSHRGRAIARLVDVLRS